MAAADRIRELFSQRGGILRLVPNWIPRLFNRPGRRMRLHPDDLFCLGAARGAIKERWFCSITPALNGPLAPPDEGLSRVEMSRDYDDTFFFRDAMDALGPDLIGPDLHKKYGAWPMFAKYFDYEGPLFHHLHLDNASASKINMAGKPEAYFFPVQMNNYLGDFPLTYFGFDPGVDKNEVRRRLENFETGDNRITELSRAYRVELGTGWYTPPGVVHAPASVLTYEPQWNSDVSSVLENVVQGEVIARDSLVSSLPDNEKNDMDAIMAMMDWDLNIDLHYKEKYFLPPLPIDSGTKEYSESWITYRNPFFAAKETIVPPGGSALVKDEAAYGCIIVQGHGSFGAYDDAEAPILLRYRQLSGDEYFVSEKAARDGVRVVNKSMHEDMVILRHFGPNAGAPTA
ncbi:MAG: hypothetical protein LUC93_00940 [Planctomycetaceae bacterium]|nr:hypothetical protein [Planctomycetaceae bacterium]